MLLLPIRQAIAAEHDRAASMVVKRKARAAQAVVKRKAAKNTAKRKRSSGFTKKTTNKKCLTTKKPKTPAELYEAAVTRSREHTTTMVSAPTDNSGDRNSTSPITTATTTTPLLLTV
jgi:hypothetical protein